MSRSSTITYEDVASVCRELASEGAKPTFKAVRSRVGGSYDVLKRFITQWLEETAAAIPNTLPQPILEDLSKLYQRLVIEADNVAQDRIDEQVGLFAAERSMLIEKLQRIEVDNRAANESRDQLGHELSLARARLEFLIPMNQNLEQKIGQLNVEKQGLETQLAHIKQQLTAQQTFVERMAERHTHELELAEERTRGTERALLMRHSAEIEPLKDKITKLSSETEYYKIRSTAFEQRFHQANTDLAKVRGQLELINSSKT
jgi:chromosome segregation ATPase